MPVINNRKEIETEQELKKVLDLCYSVLGTDHGELYRFDAWHKRFTEGSAPLVYAAKDEEVVALFQSHGQTIFQKIL